MLQCPPPPSNFFPATDVKSARIVPLPEFAKRKRYTGSRLQGIKYERKVQDYLKAIDADYIPGFWIQFMSAGQWKYCQLDGLRIDVPAGRITLVEVKLQHTSDAWWQLKHLYAPVIESLLPPKLWTYDFVEVVKWYDPATKFPCAVQLVADPFRNTDQFKVHIWRP